MQNIDGGCYGCWWIGFKDARSSCGRTTATSIPDADSTRRQACGTSDAVVGKPVSRDPKASLILHKMDRALPENEGGFKASGLRPHELPKSTLRVPRLAGGGQHPPVRGPSSLRMQHAIVQKFLFLNQSFPGLQIVTTHIRGSHLSLLRPYQVCPWPSCINCTT